MGRYIQTLSNSKFFVPSEHVGRFMACTSERPLKLGFDKDGNINKASYEGYEPWDWDGLKKAAPYIQDGSFLEFSGEEGGRFRLVFHDGKMREVSAKLTWEDPVDERVEKALEIAFKFASFDGNHHKAWAIDQMVRALCRSEEKYQAWVAEYEKPLENGDRYEWYTGIAP